MKFVFEIWEEIMKEDEKRKDQKDQNIFVYTL